MYSNLTAKKVGRNLRTKAKKTNSKTMDEKRLDVDQLALFQAAKVKELQSLCLDLRHRCQCRSKQNPFTKNVAHMGQEP